jgi:hypothetical protein
LKVPQLSLKEEIELTFELPFINKDICLRAEKRWEKTSNDELTVGIEFINVTLQEKMQLGYLIDRTLCCYA